MNPPLVRTVEDSSGVLGWVAVDSTVAGRARGGVRLLPDVSAPEIAGLARAMTLKYGLLGLPQGGAKAGVIGDPEAPPAQRRARLLAFARALADWLRQRRFVPDADMGTDLDDIRAMVEAAGLRPGRREWRVTESGYYTALTVFASARRGLEAVGRRVKDSTVAIEGFGKVGGALGGLFARAGARVVAISTLAGAVYDPQGLPVDKLWRLPGCGAGDRIPPDSLLELPVDVLCPCARHNRIHAGNAGRIQARVVAPGANNPVTPEAEAILMERGVVSVPDFVANAGGVLGGSMAFASVSRAAIEAFIETEFGNRVTALLRLAARRGSTPRQLAESIALERFEQVRRRAENPSAGGRLFGAALDLYRRGWVPGFPVGLLSVGYFRRQLAGVE